MVTESRCCRSRPDYANISTAQLPGDSDERHNIVGSAKPCRQGDVQVWKLPSNRQPCTWPSPRGRYKPNDKVLGKSCKVTYTHNMPTEKSTGCEIVRVTDRHAPPDQTVSRVLTSCKAQCQSFMKSFESYVSRGQDTWLEGKSLARTTLPNTAHHPLAQSVRSSSEMSHSSYLAAPYYSGRRDRLSQDND